LGQDMLRRLEYGTKVGYYGRGTDDARLYAPFVACPEPCPEPKGGGSDWSCRGGIRRVPRGATLQHGPPKISPFCPEPSSFCLTGLLIHPVVLRPQCPLLWVSYIFLWAKTRIDPRCFRFMCARGPFSRVCAILNSDNRTGSPRTGLRGRQRPSTRIT
jgi:hypothetical protein